jgi:hypothetical protein
VLIRLLAVLPPPPSQKIYLDIIHVSAIAPAPAHSIS